MSLILSSLSILFLFTARYQSSPYQQTGLQIDCPYTQDYYINTCQNPIYREFWNHPCCQRIKPLIQLLPIIQPKHIIHNQPLSDTRNIQHIQAQAPIVPDEDDNGDGTDNKPCSSMSMNDGNPVQIINNIYGDDNEVYGIYNKPSDKQPSIVPSPSPETCICSNFDDQMRRNCIEFPKRREYCIRSNPTKLQCNYYQDPDNPFFSIKGKATVEGSSSYSDSVLSAGIDQTCIYKAIDPKSTWGNYGECSICELCKGCDDTRSKPENPRFNIVWSDNPFITAPQPQPTNPWAPAQQPQPQPMDNPFVPAQQPQTQPSQP